MPFEFGMEVLMMLRMMGCVALMSRENLGRECIHLSPTYMLIEHEQSHSGTEFHINPSTRRSVYKWLRTRRCVQDLERFALLEAMQGGKKGGVHLCLCTGVGCREEAALFVRKHAR
jgi:hypothetical protein